MITSRQNEKIRAAKKLAEKKGRRESGMFLLEGQKLVSDAFLHGVEIETVFITAEHEAVFAGKCRETLLVSADVMESLCDAKTPQGVVAVARLPQAKPFDGSSAMVLDRMQDPKNLGSVLRTALATDIRNIFLIDCADAFSPKALRAGMSGQFKLNIIEANIAEVIKQTEGLSLVAADMDGEDVFSFKPPTNFALVLGNEGAGISDELNQHCTHRVRIPMKNGLESLNVAVSAGIMLYQLTRRHN